MIVFGLKNCDTCRKARRALQEAGHDPAFRDLRETPLDPADLVRFLNAFGEDLVNRRSTTWRGLDAAARAAPPADLIAAHPAVMKRPVIEAEGRLYLGWGKDVQAALL